MKAAYYSSCCPLVTGDWADYMPTVPRFTEKLLADKDVGKALQYVQGEVERGRWSCTLSNNCLVQFFSQGYVGRDYQTTPSGLTIFMCRPLPHHYYEAQDQQGDNG